MLKFISLILFLIIALVVAMLSIANRETVTFSLDPLPFVFDLPLYILLLAAGFLGLLIGALSGWLRRTSARMESRSLYRKLDEMTARNEKLGTELEQERAKGPAPAAPPPSTPARQLEHHAAS